MQSDRVLQFLLFLTDSFIQRHNYILTIQCSFYFSQVCQIKGNRVTGNIFFTYVHIRTSKYYLISSL